MSFEEKSSLEQPKNNGDREKNQNPFDLKMKKYFEEKGYKGKENFDIFITSLSDAEKNIFLIIEKLGGLDIFMSKNNASFPKEDKELLMLDFITESQDKLVSYIREKGNNIENLKKEERNILLDQYIHLKNLGLPIKDQELLELGGEIKILNNKVEEKNIQKIKKNKEIAKKALQYIHNQELKQKISEYILEDDIEKSNKLGLEIISFLNKGKNLENILKEAKKQGNEGFKSVYRFVENISREYPNNYRSQEILVKLHQYDDYFEEEDIKNNSLVYGRGIKDIFENGKGRKISPNKYIKENLLLDTSEYPPQAYVLGEDKEYKLEIDGDLLKATGEEISLKKDLLKIKFTLKGKGEEIKNKEEEINILINKKDKSGDDKNKVEELKKEIKEIKQEIKKLKEDGILIFKELDKLRQIGRQNLKKEIVKTRKTLSLLHSTGFDLIPQEITDTIIYEINLSEKGIIDLGGGKSLQENINIKEGKFGNGVLENEEEIFIRFFNKMISGNPTEPLNIETYKNNERNPEQFTREQILQEFRRGGILKQDGNYSKEKMRINLKAPINSQEKQTQ